MNLYRGGVAAFAAVFVALGIALIAVTAVRAGAGFRTGYLLGALFVGLGVGRLYLLRRR